MTTDIVVVLDRSGSMGSIRNDAIEGFNTFLADQKALGDAKFTLVLFDHEIINALWRWPIQKVKPLTTESYVPRGSTALLDAIGTTITGLGEEFSRDGDKRPDKVIMSILTDGEENHSREYDLPRIKEMIDHQRDAYGWNFIYLGANQDAFANSSRLGIRRSDTISFEANSAGTRAAYTGMSVLNTSYRGGNDA